MTEPIEIRFGKGWLRRECGLRGYLVIKKVCASHDFQINE